MNSERINLTRVNKLLVTIFLVSGLMYLGKPFLVPLAVAAFFAMLFFPVTKKLERTKVKRPIAALLSVLIIVVSLGILGALVYYQFRQVESDLPQLEKKVKEKANYLRRIFYQKTDISENEQEKIIDQKKPDMLASASKYAKDVFFDSLYGLLMFFVLLAYTFFFLLYRNRVRHFLVRLRLFNSEQEAHAILTKVAGITHDYLKGVLRVISILAVVYFLGFWAIGIEHALLFAIITAVLRIVPYIGSFLGIAFPIAFAFLTKDALWYPLLVLGFFMVTQLLEAYILTPYITGSKVKLNPLVTIMGILLGNLIWGIPGMILFVPLFGILKVFFDLIPKLRPFGYILGKDEDA